MISKADLLRLPPKLRGQVNLSGVWQNELGSTMSIAQAANGSLSGTYTSTVSSGGGAVNGTLVGSVADDCVGWVVNWEPTYASTTSWSGKVMADVNGNLYLYTLWLLSSGDEGLPLWQSITAGADIFTTPVAKKP